MSDYLSATVSPLLNGALDRSASRRESQISLSLIRSPSCKSIEPTSNSPHSPIYALNDDALLNIFYLYRPAILDEYEDENGDLTLDWDHQRWWYKLAHVSRRWRYLVLASPSYLDLHLFCTHGVPVAEMLAHSPPLPLTIFYDDPYHGMTVEDEKDILVALSHRDRVRRICLILSSSTLRKLIVAMDEQFPTLERMYVGCWPDEPTIPFFPRTFQAPNLRHLLLTASPIGSPLLTTTAGLVTLKLGQIPASDLPPNYLLTRLSIMLQLEELLIHFHSPLPNRDLQRQLSQTPNVTLPNLRRFVFRGMSAYLEGLIARISTPVLSVLRVELFHQLTFTIPRLLQFMHTSENFGITSISLNFLRDEFALRTEYRGEPTSVPFSLKTLCTHLDWQVLSAVQIVSGLQPVLSAVEQLRLSHEDHNRSSE
jgi:hypothetical protein